MVMLVKIIRRAISSMQAISASAFASPDLVNYLKATPYVKNVCRIAQNSPIFTL